jgi:lipopolysaccharide/colanic/teichoic acid biosynthesis glycosyltransferase
MDPDTRPIAGAVSSVDVHGADTNARPGNTDPAWLPEPRLAYRIVKRAIDVTGSALAIVALAPVLLAIGLAVGLTSKGPIFFKQTRLGYHGKPFTFLKFRTMYSFHDPQVNRTYIGDVINARRALGAYKMMSDPRITPVGRFLRRTSLDEFPQFFNVLKGDMSLVGPRPPIPYEWECYADWHKLRLSGKPGIAGLWQVHGRSRLRFDDMVRLDIQYLQNPSILSDLKILLKTPLAVLTDRASY